MISPDPLFPYEFGGEGKLTFHIGNSGNKPLHLVPNQEMTLIITLSYGIPGTDDPLQALGGTWADKFDWSYDESVNTYFAVQNQEIEEFGKGTIILHYKVSTNSPAINPANGCKVNLQPPPYSNGINSTNDDDVGFYTFVQARDFGDAPSSYGPAIHQIDVFKHPESGEYQNYVYLGNSVDPDLTDQSSANADGDDLNLTDDEDGVIFPRLIQGDTVHIPVIVKVHSFGTGIVNAWFDWNGDGDFNDENEEIGKPVSVFENDTLNLQVVIPDSANTTEPTFARFRIGDRGVIDSKTECLWGEVEDYQIQVLPSPALTISRELISNYDGDRSGTITLDDILTYTVTVTNTGKRTLTDISVSDDKIDPHNIICESLAPGETCVLVGSYMITQNDLDSDEVRSIVTVRSNETSPIVDTVLLY
jgi:hypothetical protein